MKAQRVQCFAIKSIIHIILFVLVSTTTLHCSEDFGVSTQTTHSIHSQPNVKEWTFIIYMAADNDLRSFAARNIKQMATVGSNEYLNIIVHLDIRIAGNKKITRRYYIEKNKILHVNAHDPHSQRMDSGDPQTMISCCDWALRDYPAHHYGLILWNHGTGPLDPAGGRIINPTDLFTFNPAINKFELDRSIGFLDFINNQCQKDTGKGICWDDSTGNYLTNQKLELALREIQTRCLHGKKFDIIGFDACLMAGIEIANIVKDYAHIMVSSQEVELGTGWNYQRVFAPFIEGSPDAQTFAQHIVRVYGTTYTSITNDFTQSALDLLAISRLENNLNTVATLLIECLQKQKNNSVRNAIQISRSKDACTSFDEPSYLDLHHLYSNLQTHCMQCSFIYEAEGNQLKSKLNNALEEGRKLILESVLANVTGKNLRLAQGISIYFPERKVHYSYKKTPFAAQNQWFNFLNAYLGT